MLPDTMLRAMLYAMLTRDQVRTKISLAVAFWTAAICGCGSSTNGANGFPPTTDSGAVDGGGVGADAGGPAETGGGGGSGDGGDSGGSLFGDGATVETGGGCQHLNIGILGNPGSNASSNFQSWLVSAGTSVQRIQTAAPTPTIDASTLKPFDVVILDWLTRDYSAAEASVLAAFVSGGGGLVTMSGYDNVTTDDWHANSLLAPLAVAYTGQLLSPSGAEIPVTDFAPHPITAGLTSVSFKGGYAIADLGGSASTRTPIAFLPDPSGTGTLPVGFAVQMSKGRAFVWGDEWISFDSEWSTIPQIKQLWVQVFAWVSPTNTCPITPPQ
jgi:hypothetical protein